MVQVYLGIGSNTNRQQNIALALSCLKAEFGELLISPVYESQPVDDLGADYYNLVVGFESDKSPQQLRSFLHEVEDALGRDRLAPDQVTIDLDLLIHGDLYGTFDDFQLPHPDLTRYRHMLQPLVDIAGDETMPGQQLKYGDLLESLNLQGQIDKVRG
ncbi:2-amino-4-hydroxy-6-hydroxymethyldihydropteridine diphosphokinase [Proteobacteria bacterium 005FR1]|nr:2-amino-4-hydroxy-6-hydroxymethyldihydropteridine diphosphokinase [Proteobacteria bacterium 005FR1]